MLDIAPCRGGANNRVYRVRTADTTYALKAYGDPESDHRDRLAHEFDGLRFLAAAGIRNCIPVAVAADRSGRCALYEWIEGEKPLEPGISDIDELLRLLSSIHAARGLAGSQALPEAVEATFSIGEILAQLDRRLLGLREVAAAEPELERFLADLEAEIERRRRRLSGRALDDVLPGSQQSLSPSDVGFHNALRRADGGLVFLDFEYFGWDDPVKLTADFLWHPAMSLGREPRLHFLAGATDIYGDDADFQQRLELCFPLFGIRWCFIILNEFLPARWKRRVFSGSERQDWAASKRAQLAKARRLFERIAAHGDGGLA